MIGTLKTILGTVSALSATNAVANAAKQVSETELSPQAQTTIVIVGFLTGAAFFALLLWVLAKYLFKLESADYKESFVGIIAGGVVGVLVFKVLHPLFVSVVAVDILVMIAGVVFMVVVTATIMGSSKKAYLSTAIIYAIMLLFGYIGKLIP